MPDSVFFDGVDDFMRFSIGSAAIPAGPITIAMVVKDNSFTLGNYDALLVAEDGGTNRWWTTYLFGDVGGTFVMSTTAGDDTGAAAVELETLGLVGQWVLLVVTKANGAVAPRYHRYDSTFGWDHQNSPGTLANGTTPPGTAKIQLGLDSLFGSPADVNVLIFGIKSTVMSDGEIEALSGGYAAWQAAGFTEGIRLNSISAPTNFAGGTMVLESVSGAVLDPGDAPSWWVEGSAGYSRVVGPAHLPSSPTLLYTVPTGFRLRLRNIFITNPTGTTKTVTLSVGADAASTRILDAAPILSGSFLRMRSAADITLNAGDTLYGSASAATSCVIVVNGYLYAV